MDLSPAALRRTVLLVAALNLAGAVVEWGVATAIGSVSLVADSVDFLEDAAVNTLIALALGLSLAARARFGKVMALVICLPALAAVWETIDKVRHPEAPETMPLVLTALAAAALNTVCALLLVRVREHGGSMGAAAWLAARNDVAINLTIVAMAAVTAWVGNGWPDIVLGVVIVVLNLGAAKEVWELAEEESLAARALAGQDVDDD